MVFNEQKKEEIKTIRERNIAVKLSDADCEKLARWSGEAGLTVGELLANFIGDLVGGTYSNGSDEEELAEQWYKRCWFGSFQEPTLLNHLLKYGHEPEEYLELVDDIETALKEKEYLAEHPEEANEEAQYIDSDIEDCEERLSLMREGWRTEKKTDMEKEIEIIKKWVKEKEHLLGE